MPNRLDSLEEELLELRSRFTERDAEIVRLKEKRSLLIKLLKKRSIGYLKSMLIAEEAKLESAKRPKEVLFKYKDLLRQSSRDESTLVSLEDNLRSIELEEAKIEDPWQLITKPTLFINPVAPSRKRIGLLGLLSGFLLSISFAFLKEKKSGIIYDEETLEIIFNSKILEKINSFNKKKISSEFLFLEQLLATKIEDRVSLISVGQNSLKGLNELSEFVKYMNLKYNEKNNWLFIDNKMEELAKSKYKLVLTTLGSLKSNEVTIFNKRLKALNQNISGILIFNKINL